MSEEIWLPIADNPDYEVSSEGRVRSIDRLVPCGRYPGGYRLAKGTLLKQDVSNTGYHRVSLSGVHKAVHVAVAEAFLGERPDGMHVCHNDGDKKNNAADNLRYDTPSENVQDSVRHGTQAQARKTHCPQGHAYTTSNTTIVRTPSGTGRHCRTCKRIRERSRRRAKIESVPLR